MRKLQCAVGGVKRDSEGVHYTLIGHTGWVYPLSTHIQAPTLEIPTT